MAVSQFFTLQKRTGISWRLSPAVVFIVAALGCATGGSPSPGVTESPAESESPSRAVEAADRGPQIPFSISVTNILGAALPARVRLEPRGPGQPAVFEVPEGTGSFTYSAGQYTAYIYAYDDNVPILVDVKPLGLSPDQEQTPVVSISVLEGSSGNRTLRAFDRDLDMALDRVEVAHDTDPDDALSAPGLDTHRWESPVLVDDGAWYRGELHAYSEYGPGSESVAALVRRAESAGLDFLAITDPNTLAAAFDPGFHSERVVLIPAMEWGTAETGMALLYAPGMAPRVPASRAEAQAEAIRVQAQGGIFAIAHPLRPEQSWQWGLSYFNAVEVWCGEWRQAPPARLAQLDERWRARDERGELVYAVAEAAATDNLSGNAQSALFYDLQVNRGMKSCVIAGSRSTGRRQPLGEPVTYVYGREKSLKGILEGLRRGRTFISKGLGGPTIEFQADVLADGTIDTGIGGIIPINKPSRLVVGVKGAKGARLEILLNGLPIRSRPIESDKLYYSMMETPGAFGVYRVRVVTRPDEVGYGFADMLAMTSPIYAQGYVVDSEKGETGGWIEIENAYDDSDLFHPETIRPSQVRTLQPRQVTPND